MPAIPLPRHSPALRRLALRAIMDGRGVEAVILSSPRSLAHYGGMADADGALLVVTAREARFVQVQAGNARGAWSLAAALLPWGCALGHEAAAADERGLAALVQVVRPRRVLCIAADVARQIEGW